jgi:DNA-binding LacI/PurR family transcriptional regulator/DNA-binding transcriptional regulator YhcF (GntR family)
MKTRTTGKAGSKVKSVRTGAPPYRVICDDLRRRIGTEPWVAGAMLPGRRDLAAQYGVNLNTLNRAIALLTQEGLLHADDRRGTFVASPAVGVPSSGPLTTANLSDKAPVVAIIVRTDAEVTSPLAVKSDGTADIWHYIAIQSLERACSLTGGSTRTLNVWPGGPGNHGSPGAAIRAAHADGADALVVVNLNGFPDWDGAALAARESASVPLVYLGGVASPLPLSQFFFNQHVAGYLAAEHLIANGYRRILFFRPFEAEWITERISGAQEAVRRAQGGIQFGILPDHPRCSYDDLVHRADRAALLREVFREAMRATGESYDGSTAIIAPSDHEALPLLEFLTESGKTPGRDLGVIGFDDIPFAGRRGLSTMRPPLEAIAEAAVEHVLKSIRKPSAPVRVAIAPTVIRRASTERRPGRN